MSTEAMERAQALSDEDLVNSLRQWAEDANNYEDALLFEAATRIDDVQTIWIAMVDHRSGEISSLAARTEDALFEKLAEWIELWMETEDLGEEYEAAIQSHLETGQHTEAVMQYFQRQAEISGDLLTYDQVPLR